MQARAKLVFGFGGQDGKLLTKDLTSKGFPVVGVGRKEVTFFSSHGHTVQTFARPLNLVTFLADVNPDQIYYLAANHRSAQDSTASEISGSGFHELFERNVNPYAEFLISVEESGIDADIFFASSALVFEGNPDSRLDETSALRPRGYYGMAKAQGIWLGQKFREERGLRIYSGILFNHESHLRKRDFFTARVIYGAIEICEGLSSHLGLGRLDGLVDWGYARDYVEGFQKILASGHPSDFLVATGQKNSPRLFVDLVFRFFNLDWQDYVIENPTAFPQRIELGNADISKLKGATGWEPSYTFEEMVVQLTKDHLNAYNSRMREDRHEF